MDLLHRQPRPFRLLKVPVAKEYFKRVYLPVGYQKKNSFIVVSGDPGTGKSVTTLWHSMMLCNWFGPDTFHDKIVYMPSGFFNALENVKGVGDSIMWDEMGAGLPRQEWWQASSLAVKKTLQIFRGAGGGSMGRVFLFMVAPDPSFIDTQAWKMAKMFINCRSDGFNYGFSPYFLKHDRFMGRTYRNTMRFVHGNIEAKVSSFIRPDVGEEVLKAYEDLSRPSKNQLLKEFKEFGLLDDISRRDLEDKLIDEIVEEILTKKEVRDVVVGMKGKVSPSLVKEYFKTRGLSRIMATTVAKRANRRLS